MQKVLWKCEVCFGKNPCYGCGSYGNVNNLKLQEILDRKYASDVTLYIIEVAKPGSNGEFTYKSEDKTAQFADIMRANGIPYVVVQKGDKLGDILTKLCDKSRGVLDCLSWYICDGMVTGDGQCQLSMSEHAYCVDLFWVFMEPVVLYRDHVGFLLEKDFKCKYKPEYAVFKNLDKFIHLNIRFSGLSIRQMAYESVMKKMYITQQNRDFSEMFKYLELDVKFNENTATQYLLTSQYPGNPRSISEYSSKLSFEHEYWLDNTPKYSDNVVAFLKYKPEVMYYLYDPVHFTDVDGLYKPVFGDVRPAKYPEHLKYFVNVCRLGQLYSAVPTYRDLLMHSICSPSGAGLLNNVVKDHHGGENKWYVIDSFTLSTLKDAYTITFHQSSQLTDLQENLDQLKLLS